MVRINWPLVIVVLMLLCSSASAQFASPSTSGGVEADSTIRTYVIEAVPGNFQHGFILKANVAGSDSTLVWAVDAGSGLSFFTEADDNDTSVFTATAPNTTFGINDLLTMMGNNIQGVGLLTMGGNIDMDSNLILEPYVIDMTNPGFIEDVEQAGFRTYIEFADDAMFIGATNIGNTRERVWDFGLAEMTGLTTASIGQAKINGDVDYEGNPVTGTYIANQTLKGNHIDSVSEDFVFDEAYKVTSAVADSAYATEAFVTLSVAGEANTLLDTGTFNGTEGFGLAGGKTGVALKVKGLIEGSNITITASGDSAFSIASAGGGGTSDSIGYGNAVGTGVDAFLFPAYFFEGAGITFTITGEDSLSIVSTLGVSVDLTSEVTGELPDANVADNITASLYLPLSGGTMTGSINASTFPFLVDTIIIDGDTLYPDHIPSYNTQVVVHNATGATLSKGLPVCVSGATGDIPNADSARADNASFMPAMGILKNDIANGADGLAITGGVALELNTNGWAVGDPVYVQPTGGADTVKPVGTDLIQKIGHVTRVNATQGSILVASTLRSNDIPNIPSANFWLGNASGVATAVSMSGQATMDNAGVFTIDSTSNNVPFDGAYHITTAEADSAYVTGKTVSDSLALALLKTGGTAGAGATFNMNNGHIIGADVFSGDTLILGGHDTLVSHEIAAYVIRRDVHNASGATLSKGTPVYISGATGDIPNADSARADNAAMMPAIGLLEADIANGAEGHVINGGALLEFNTSGPGWSVGDALYVGATGGLTSTKPTGTNEIQKVGIVTRVNAAQGNIFVAGAGRSNDLPNIASTNFWVGNGSGVATAVAMSSDATMDNTGAVTIANDVIDSTNIPTGGLSFSDDLRTFTEAELETQLSDVTDVFTNNDGILSIWADTTGNPDSAYFEDQDGDTLFVMSDDDAGNVTWGIGPDQSLLIFEADSIRFPVGIAFIDSGLTTINQFWLGAIDPDSIAITMEHVKSLIADTAALRAPIASPTFTTNARVAGPFFAEGDIHINKDSTAVDAILYMGDDDEVATMHFDDANDRFEFSKTIRSPDTLDYIFNLANPDALFAADAEWCFVPRTRGPITIVRIDVTLDADPTTELEYSIRFADAFIGFASETTIEDTATVAGITTVTSITGDATVPANKTLFVQIEADPDDNITQAAFIVSYTVD